ncbi:hypothetical protein FsymDg_4401 [Candidatus Protofrankia datiscae]|uniref:Uncharacterized protein n=1 Tax=Candidatus Protofrankia datiscae TaxID=2716812 RepID=F8AZC4_9ACTN|nr:hypothetical protein FsymDg_4401 [Candidatus Protofrankia datiscae]
MRSCSFSCSGSRPDLRKADPAGPGGSAAPGGPGGSADPGHPERRRTENDAIIVFLPDPSFPPAGRIRRAHRYGRKLVTRARPTWKACRLPRLGTRWARPAELQPVGSVTARRRRNELGIQPSGSTPVTQIVIGVQRTYQETIETWGGRRCDTCVSDGSQQRRTRCKNHRNYSRLLVDVRKLPTVIGLVSHNHAPITSYEPCHNRRHQARRRRSPCLFRTSIGLGRPGTPAGRRHHARRHTQRYAQRYDGFTTALPSPDRPRGTPPSA